MADWRKLLRGHVHQAQQVLRRLIVGRLTFTPKGKHYAFAGVGTVKPLLGVVQNVASPPGIDRGGSAVRREEGAGGVGKHYLLARRSTISAPIAPTRPPMTKSG